MVLTVYSASAGSGKTYRLTADYLKLCFNNPEDYKHILAVTFTNKATAEMKYRIISELHNIASGGDSLIFEEIAGLNPENSREYLRLRAREILRKILFAYHHFNISTIDSFFQKLMRSFTRELGIHVSYNVELESKKVLEEAGQRVINLASEDDHLTKWLTDYALDKMSEKQSWKFKEDILELSKESLNEVFGKYASNIIAVVSDSSLLNDVKLKLIDIKNEFESHQKKKSEQALEMISSAGLEIKDFNNKDRGVAGWLSKLVNEPDKSPGNNVKKVLDGEQAWYAKDTSAANKNSIEKLLSSGLSEKIQSLYEYYHQNIRKYNAAKITLKTLYVLGLMGYLTGELSKIRTENNILMLSDVNLLLRQLTKSEEAPFIYEKSGTWLNHLFIDEFQDTSGFQWDNLLVLVKNCLSSGFPNLIVGDVKQSIYRWRGGDWLLLLQKIYEDLGTFKIVSKTLEKNFRSCRQIVGFNNLLFSVLSENLSDAFVEEKQDEISDENDKQLADILRKAYRDVVQQVAEKNKDKNGLVRAEFLQTDETQSWKSKVNEKLVILLRDLMDKNYHQSDIAILTRTNEEGKQITEFLLEKTDFSVVSEETLALGSSLSVRFIICCLKYILDESDFLNLAEMYILHEKLVHQKIIEFENLERLIFSKGNTEVVQRINDIRDNENILSLYSLIIALIRKFLLEELSEEHAYLTGFLNLVMDFSISQNQSVFDFLEYWEEKGCKQSVRVSENADGIKVMTIHKAKGLQFKIVIIPYCNWKIDHNPGYSQFVWCRSESEPFNLLPLIPLKYSNDMKRSIFHYEYYQEKLYAWMDNLNTLYVALTRAEDGMFIFSELKDRENISTVGDLLYLNIKQNCPELTKHWNAEENVYHDGILLNLGDSEKQPEMTDIPFSGAGRNMNVLKTENYKNPDDNRDNISKLETGRMMHIILSKIKTAADAVNIINELVLRGEIPERHKDIMLKWINEICHHPEINDWFTDNWEIITEQPILVPHSSHKIPDRIMIRGKMAVVIDFKFSEKHNKYREQVRAYADLIEKMGYSPVEAYLIYCNEEQIVPEKVV